MVNVVAAFKNVHRFGKHAFISDSSDDFRFCPRASVQINPSFEFSGHLPIHFVDDAVPEKKQIFQLSRKFKKICILMFQFYKILLLFKGRKYMEIIFSLDRNIFLISLSLLHRNYLFNPKRQNIKPGLIFYLRTDMTKKR